MASQGMTALANFTVATAQATVTFSNIPATYRDLMIVINASTTAANDGTDLIRFNADSGANYSLVWMEGNGASASSSSQAGAAGIYDGSNVTPITNALTTSTWHVLDYSATDKHKSVLVRTSVNTTRGSSGAGAFVGRWANTAAVTSLSLNAQNSTTYAAGSTFTLYGIVS